jgi:hypothetical protein
MVNDADIIITQKSPLNTDYNLDIDIKIFKELFNDNEFIIKYLMLQ